MPSYYVDEDYPARPEIQYATLFPNEAITVAQNRPLWRLMSTFHATLLVVRARKEEHLIQFINQI